VIFVGLTLHSHRYIVNVSTASMELSEAVVRGKHVWERHSCINCHSLHGEGAYFAPEVGNVMTRWGVLEDADASFEALKAWMDAQPSGVEGRRQMPAFGLTDEEYRDLSEFLRWSDKMDTQNWPPNDAG
jgi:nitric oxide reductase subunit C